MHDLRVLEKIVADADARRELLWLRAHEKEDEDEARALERTDPGIVARLKAAGFDIGDDPDEVPRMRRERFARLWHDCYDRHAEAARAAEPATARRIRVGR